MAVFIQANTEQEHEISSSVTIVGSAVHFSHELPDERAVKDFECFLILDTPATQLDYAAFNHKPVLINEVVDTLDGMQNPENVSRINGWPGFLNRPLWEVVTHDAKELSILSSLFNRKIVFLKDVPGFVAARTVSMIINEAYYALREGVSTRKEIDMAMKLGTNYPFGPFEWAERIGLQNIYDLLTRLARTNSLYQPSFPNPTL